MLYQAVSACGVELFSVPIDGSSAPIQLATEIPVQTFTVTPDSATVIYKDDDNRLVAQPVGGGAAVLLSSQSDVSRIQLTTDGSRLVYSAALSESGPFELFTVPVSGGPAARLSQNLTAGRDVRAFRITPDEQTVIYWGDLKTNGVFELFSVPLSGGVPVRISQPLVTGGDVKNYRISATPNASSTPPTRTPTRLGSCMASTLTGPTRRNSTATS